MRAASSVNNTCRSQLNVRQCSGRTVDAVVGGVEVGGEVLGTGLDAPPQTRHRHLAPAPAGTGGVEQADDVRRAADEAVVTRHAPAK